MPTHVDSTSATVSAHSDERTGERSLVLAVNGRRCEVRVDPATPLLYVLRNDLGLRAAKLGCGLEQCGACAVLLGGEAVLSCGMPVGQVGTREVTTVEGLSEGEAWHPLQAAFLAENAAQCGFCTPGMMIAAAALLAWHDAPARSDIDRALASHLCRCGAHPRIVRAIERAARGEGT
jgi:aerobic-type carbon monoxide dehydrogenase small subunit (CoxS/CutS family)